MDYNLRASIAAEDILEWVYNPHLQAEEPNGIKIRINKEIRETHQQTVHKAVELYVSTLETFEAVLNKVKNGENVVIDYEKSIKVFHDILMKL